MLKKLRKSSSHVTLVLIGVAAIAGCGEQKRDVYASREDCLADWGNKPEDCTPATEPGPHRPRLLLRADLSRLLGSERVRQALDAARRARARRARAPRRPRAAASASRAARARRAASAMKREERVPRPDWPQKVEELGFHFHTMDGVYWDERACYRFTAAQVDKLELATAELQTRCIEAAGRVIESGDFERFRIPEAFHALIERLLGRRREVALRALRPVVGRQRRAQDARVQRRHAHGAARGERGAVVLAAGLLPEGRPVQLDPREAGRALEGDRASSVPGHGRVHFTCVADSLEDQGNLDYLRDTAIQAGLDAQPIDIADIGWNGKRFVDLEERADRRALQALSVGMAGARGIRPAPAARARRA